MANNRWNTPEEIKKALVPGGQPGKGGVILHQEKGVNWVDPGESHTMIVGTTGSGKTRRCIIPLLHMLLDSEESIIVVDPKKGELYRATAAKAMEKGYDVYVINLQDLIYSEQYNPLDLIWLWLTSQDPALQEAGHVALVDLGKALFPGEGAQDPYWPCSARTLFEGTVMALIHLGTPEEVHLSNVYRMIADSRKGMGIGSLYRQLLEALPKESTAHLLLQSYTHAPNDTASSTQAVCLESLVPFIGSAALQSMLSGGGFRIADLDGERPTAIYIEMADETQVYDPIASVLISQLMDWYIKLAQNRYNGALPRRMNIILEELGSLGRALGGLDHLLSASRSRNIRCHMVLQSLTSQLETLYGTSKANTIQANAALKIVFRTDHVKTLTQLSQLCGQRTILTRNFAATEPLITISQLAAMKTGQALVHSEGMKFVTKLRDYSEYISCPSVELPQRAAAIVIPPVFDLEEYLREQKRQRTMEEIERMDLSELTEHESVDDGDKQESKLDQMIAAIDRQIAELEKEEAEKAAMPDGGETGNTLVLIAVEGPNCFEPVQQVVEQYAGVTPDTAQAIVHNLPFLIDFDNQKQAEEAKKAFSDAGGVVILQETQSGD